jgi:tetratricopeptide (TPR) repeat protein
MKNVLIGGLVIIGLLLAAGCGQDKDLKLAAEKAQKGDNKEAIELYTAITMHQKNAKVLDQARLALAKIYYQDKNYENALKNLDEISKDRQADPAVQDLRKTVTAENNAIEGLKSAALQYRQQCVKEKEIKHEAVDYAAPIFAGTIDELFGKAGIKPPAENSMGTYKVEIRLTDDPLEPTKLKIIYPNGSAK